jgi:hypothetical protein
MPRGSRERRGRGGVSKVRHRMPRPAQYVSPSLAG